MTQRRVLVRAYIGAVAAMVVLAALVTWLNVRGESPLDRGGDGSAATSPAAAATIARGAYLARAGNCYGCHTERGGAPYAGGRAIETPFGIVYSSNLTPHPATGLGRWSKGEFWRAMHHGRSRDGRLLYPAFPYPNYTRVSRADADAIHDWLMTLPAVARAQPPHALDFPYGTQAALAVWRALFFRPGEHVDDDAKPAAWNRGAYLVEGLGHCNACHSARNAFGATVGPLDLQGGLIPVQNWYAPSLASPREAGVADWPEAEVVRLLKTGIAGRGVVTGPMSEVVLDSTQHLSDADLGAIATYLKRLPPPPLADGRPAAARAPSARGGSLYRDHCSGCHGERGEGVAGAYPALGGNRALTMPSVANLVHVVVEGGFPPATAGNPRPYGMPPFATVLSDADLAELLGFVRGSWGNRAPAVSALDVARARDGPR